MRPPRISELLVRITARRDDRAFVLGDLAGEHDRLAASEGLRAARAWYRAQARRSLHPLLATRVSAWRQAFDRPATIQDLSNAFRWLRRHPGLVAIVSGTLSAAFAAGLAALAVADAAVLHPLPYPSSDALVSVWTSGPKRPASVRAVSWPDFQDLRRTSTSFSALEASAPVDYSLTGVGDPREVTAMRVSEGFDRLTALPPAAGRFFSRDEYQPGAEHVVMLQHRFWVSAFGGDPSVVGKSLELGAVPFRVVGVTSPRPVSLPVEEHDLWVPLVLRPGVRWETPRNTGWLTVTGRLRDGVSPRRAADEVTSLAASLAAEFPDSNAEKVEGRVVRLDEQLSRPLIPVLTLLSAALAAVLLVACGNVTNLLLAASARRKHEFFVRKALGAGRARLIGQVFFEHLAMTGLAGVAALALAPSLARAFFALSPDAVRGATVPLLSPMSAVVCGLLVVGAAVFLTLPHALGASQNGADDGVRTRVTSSRRDRAVRHVLVATQTALSLLLAVWAVAFARTAYRLSTLDAGYRPEQVLTLNIVPPPARGRTGDATLAFYGEVLDALAGVPGVRSAAAGVGVPLTLSGWSFGIRRPGAAAQTLVGVNLVSDRYFETLGTRLLAGRLLSPEEQRAGAQMVVVNDSLARVLATDGSVVGTTLDYSNLTWHIVGVVEGARQFRLREPARPELFLPWSLAGQRPQAFVVRAEGDPTSLVPALTARVHQVDGSAIVSRVIPLESSVRKALGAEFFRAILLTALAALAVVLAAFGVYSVTAHVVSSRQREYGIRLALGASRPSIIRRALWSIVLPVSVGAAAGVAAVVVTSGATAAFLFETSARDATTLAGSASALLTITVAAGWRSARLAADTNPVALLTGE